MVRFDIDDRSDGGGVAARYRFGAAELAPQWRRTAGTPLSDDGATLQAQCAQMELRHSPSIEAVPVHPEFMPPHARWEPPAWPALAGGRAPSRGGPTHAKPP